MSLNNLPKYLRVICWNSRWWCRHISFVILIFDLSKTHQDNGKLSEQRQKHNSSWWSSMKHANGQNLKSPKLIFTHIIEWAHFQIVDVNSTSFSLITDLSEEYLHCTDLIWGGSTVLKKYRAALSRPVISLFNSFPSCLTIITTWTMWSCVCLPSAVTQNSAIYYHFVIKERHIEFLIKYIMMKIWEKVSKALHYEPTVRYRYVPAVGSHR